MKYVISQASHQDAEAIIKYLNKVGDETDFLTFGAGEFWLTIEEERECIKNLQQSGKGVMMIAKSEGIIIAQGLCVSKEKRSAHVFELSITVAKNFWGNGIGTEMIRKMEEAVGDLGAEKITLSVCSANDRAIRLYQKLGYQEEGLLKKDHKIGNEYHDTIIMSK